MTGYVQCFGPCYQCHTPFSYSPTYVPSLTVAGERVPFCRSCIEAANPIRVAKGLAPIVPHPMAYEATPVEEA